MPHFFEFSATHPARNPSPPISKQPRPNKKKNISIYIQLVTNQGENSTIDSVAEMILVCFLLNIIDRINPDPIERGRCIVQ
jgi:hypothetical protein